MNTRHILWIEPEADLCEAFPDFLQRQGYKVTVWNGEALSLDILLHLLFQNQPQLVMLSLRFTATASPGFELLEGLIRVQQSQRSPQSLRTMPVVILSSYSLPDYESQAYHRGARGYLLKPFSFAELLQTVEAAF